MAQYLPVLEWDTLVEDIIVHYGFHKMKLPDAAKYGLDGTVDSWKRLICQLCKRESNFIPTTTYKETMLDGQISTGLFQLSYSSTRSYAKFAKDEATRKLLTSVTTESLKVPATNIIAAFVIFNRWLTTDKVVARKESSGWKGLARYHSPFRKSDFAPQVLARKPIATKEKLAAVKPVDGKPTFPSAHKFHPQFKVPKPYTHLHPQDVLRSVTGEKEISGSKNNPLIAHFHEHSANLGKHTDGAKYSDEVPHCSSALNWACDMAGCEKTDNALAASWKKYPSKREGDWVEEGDFIVLGTRHVTTANKRFNRKSAKSFEGFGSNQGNSIKTSVYSVSEISAVLVPKPKAGTVLAPIGILGFKPTPVTGGAGESTT